MQTFLPMLHMFIRDDLLIIGAIGVGCAMIAAQLERRKNFLMRVGLSFVIASCWMLLTNKFVFEWTGSWETTGIIRYLGLFLIFILSVPFWSKASFCQTLFAITVSYSIQNMCERLIEIPRYGLKNFPVLLDRFCLLLMFVIVLSLFYRLYIARSNRKTAFDFSNMNKRYMLLLSSGVMSISVVLDIIMRSETSGSGLVMFVCNNIMSALFSLLIIVLCIGHLKETDSERRAEVALQLLQDAQRHYKHDKLVYDTINIKCHDIRHQIAALGDGAHGDELQKISKVVDVYDSALRTHSAALDVVLSNKAIVCNKKGITLTCLGDGRTLNFMQASDVYALFGNILDNAIEAAAKVEDRDKRLVSLTLSTRDSLLLIEAENFFSGTVDFEEGLPLTTKTERDYHGFGTRSIQLLTDKYGGNLKFNTHGGIFRLSIMLPTPA